jgi:hypothetical protein
MKNCYVLFLTVVCCAFSANRASAQILINEVLASNASVNADPDYGNYADWIELYNAGPATVDLSGFFLSDNAGTPLKFAFPAGTAINSHGFLLVWADGNATGLHANFKISSGGEVIVLSDPAGTLLDQVTFPAQSADISFGRVQDGNASLGYFTHPTPGASNNTSTAFGGFAAFSTHCQPAGGFFSGAQTVTIRNPSGIGTVRYSLDGSVPNANSPVYTAPLSISATTVLKCRVFRTGKIPGPIEVNTYFIHEQFDLRGTLPVVSLSNDPKYFFAPDSGLYAQDFKPDWEYPIHVEMYEPDGTLAFHHDAGVTIGGENAWALPQKPLNIHSRKQYGASKITYQIFPDNPRNEFDNVTFRCSGNDWSQTEMRDNLEQHLSTPNANLDIQDYRFCIVFINGQYWGIHSIVTQQGSEYYQYKYGVKSDSIDEIYNDGTVLLGDAAAYQSMVALLDAGVQDNAAFASLEQKMDVRNYTDYIQDEIFCANTSWGHNIGCWRIKNDTARFRWEPFDFDRGFYMANAGSTDMSWFTDPNGQAYLNPAWATLWLRKMLENDGYKKQFYARFADHLYVTFHPRTINHRIDRLSGQIRSEIPYHVNRWAGTSSNYGNGLPSVAYWENEVNNLRSYAGARQTYLYTNLNTFFGLSGTSPLNLNVSNQQAGTIRIHDIRVPEYPWSGVYYKNVPVHLTAEPKTGFNFVRWEKSTTTDASIIAPGSVWKYHDTADDPQTAWRQPGFDDGSWPSGPAQLGYGDGDEATTIDYGGNAANKIISYYFRRKFNVSNPAAVSGLHLQMIVDDGAVVYINGNEVARYNMPAGNIGTTTLASTSISGATEGAWQDFNLPASVLQSGDNTIAIEIHQAAANSSDISFDLQLAGQTAGAPVVVGTNPGIDLMLADTGLTYTAIFESNGACILPDTISSDLTLVAACSPYLAQGNVTLQPNVHLTVEPGVEIRFPEAADFWILGQIDINGTQAAPCTITTNAATGASKWGGMLFWYPTDESHLNYLTLDKASAGKQRLYFPAAISVFHGKVVMDHITALTTFDNPIVGRFSDLTLKNSTIKLPVTGDCINVKYGKGYVENNVFEGGTAIDADGVDFDGVVDGVIRHNVVHHFVGSNDDGLDIGEQCQNLLIEENFIYDCFDKGISVGQQSSVTIRNNTIAYTTLGMGLKDESQVTVDHCTIFGTQKAITAYEKHPGDLGGIAVITNTLACNSAISGFSADTTASLSISNSLTDTEAAPAGPGNLGANPVFVGPTWYDFNLYAGSPALGSGTAGSDMGAIYHPVYPGQPQLMFSEIYYNDTQNGDGEFLEILNPGSETRSLSGYTLTDAVEFKFPSQASINPGEHIIVARTASLYIGHGYQVFQWTKGHLSNEGERIVLNDSDGILADFVRYKTIAPWPDTVATYGRSLELVSQNLDNHFQTSWQISGPGGTPGDNPVATGEPQNTGLQLDVFPNPAGDVVNLALHSTAAGDFAIRIYNLEGRVCVSETMFVPTGQASRQVNMYGLAAGTYLATVADRQGRVVGKVIFVKQ